MKHLALQISTVVAVLLSGTAAYAQQKTLYERLGGVFAIAAVVNHFSDAVVKNPIVGQKIEEPRPPGMAHQKSGQTSGAQIHAHAVGLQRCGWTLPIYSHETRRYSRWSGSSASRIEDLSRGVR